MSALQNGPKNVGLSGDSHRRPHLRETVGGSITQLGAAVADWAGGEAWWWSR
jgi:hypothetical protein